MSFETWYPKFVDMSEILFLKPMILNGKQLQSSGGETKLCRLNSFQQNGVREIYYKEIFIDCTDFKKYNKIILISV